MKTVRANLSEFQNRVPFLELWVPRSPAEDERTSQFSQLSSSPPYATTSKEMALQLLSQGYAYFEPIRIVAKSGHTEFSQFPCVAGNPDLNCRSPPRNRRSLRDFWENFGGESTWCLNQHAFWAKGRHAPMYNPGNQRQISLGEGRLGYRSKRRSIRNRIGRS